MRAKVRGRLAAVTMVYNEPDFLPLWARYYGKQAPDACYVIDHGSTDGSTSNLLGVSVVRLPRSPMDDTLRAAFISEFCASLLRFYDAVIYTDADEFVVVDPAKYSSLADAAEQSPADTITSFGMNVMHKLDAEPPLDLSAPILQQRPYALPVSAMCKPSLTRKPIQWEAGFHKANAPLAFDGLYNFHLARCDLGLSIRRQVKRRATVFADPRHGIHHQQEDAEIERQMRVYAGRQPIEAIEFDRSNGHFAAYMDRLVDGQAVESNIISSQLWRIPERFRDAF